MRYANLLFLVVLLAGCDKGSDTAGEPAPMDDRRDDSGRGSQKLDIEESDLYRLTGDQLYVYNYTRGLYAIDVSNAAAPALRATADIFGPAGELYADGQTVLLLLEAASTDCKALAGMALAYQPSELVILSDEGSTLSVQQRVCLAGQIVATRLLNQVLYVVASDPYQGKSSVAAIDVADPQAPQLNDFVNLAGDADEIYFNSEALFVTRPVEGAAGTSARITYFDVRARSGRVTERGSLTVRGAPQGRFHMDAVPGSFRLVTFDANSGSSVLHVIDTSNPDQLRSMGELSGIGAGEQLFATRFVGDRAYVVTYRQVDPLWVIDLSQATRPALVGELWVPGWSDFIFPRGDQLITVGRGPSFGVAVALFDVSDPARPRQVDSVEFGWGGASEATIDYRALRVIEAGPLGDPALIAIPTSRYAWQGDGSTGCASELELVDLRADGLEPRGILATDSAVRRSFPVGDRLFLVSDLAVESVELADRDQPRVAVTLHTGEPALVQDACAMGGPEDGMWMGDDMVVMGCAAVGGGGCELAAVLLLVAVRRLRRR